MSIHTGRAWGSAECVSMCVKVKAAEGEAVMHSLHLGLNVFKSPVPAGGHETSSDFFQCGEIILKGVSS